MKLNKYLFIFLFALLGLTSSCVDDYFKDDQQIGEGETTVEAKVVFSPVLDALDNTRAAGDALKHINSLLVVVYDEDNKYMAKYLVYNNNTSQGEYNCTITDNDATAPDAIAPDDTHQAETKTPQASFKLPEMQFGEYYIYAVANMGGMDEDKYKECFNIGTSTPEDLKSVELTWNEKEIGTNDQMLGYFTNIDVNQSNGFEAPKVIIKGPNQKIHAWVKRAASKVTVAVDGSGLYDGVQVWIKSIQIRDIPRTCWLGKENTPSSYHLIADGEKIVLSDEGGAEKGELVTNTQNYPAYGDAHDELSNALYLYENMQGKGQSKKQVWESTTDKTKPQYPDGNNPMDPGFKDSKRDGSYIEVIGYYKNEGTHNSSKKGEGPIIYRFMLGKDVDKDYDVERNYHYKLTLKLKNNANDSDWHIVYDQEPTILTQDPYYISYLYDQEMDYPLKILGGELMSLTAEITKSSINDNSWHPLLSATGEESQNKNVSPYYTGQIDNPGPWNGFLSLQQTEVAGFGIWPGDNNFGPSGDLTYIYNETYWEDNKRGYREYNVTPGIHVENNGNYTIKNNGFNAEWEVTIPLFTRAKVMVSQTGYTGNNPYVSYMREAEITVRAKVKKADGEIKTVTEKFKILQVRRIVNPKGIWRAGNDASEFQVNLKVLENEQNSEFRSLYSIGPWRAEIEVGDWFDIEPTANSHKNPDGSISGNGDMYPKNLKSETDVNKYDRDNAGRQIDFIFRPKGTIGENGTPRGGVIKIYYNNYSCVHRIFVRQGYAPVQFATGGPKWHTGNLVSATAEVTDPVLEGSYFREYRIDLPIDASNNNNDWVTPLPPADDPIKFLHNGLDRDFKIVGKTEPYKWEKIKGDKNSIWRSFDFNGKTCRFPEKKDFEAVAGTNTNPKNNIIYGYGVLYTGGSSKVAEKVLDAYGAGTNGPSDISGKGMRGIFVCDINDGTQIFLPIGKTGYGRFKQKSSKDVYNRLPAGMGGVIQYANRYTEMSRNGYGVQYKPLFWDLYRRQGTLYWMGSQTTAYGATWWDVLDINYYSFDIARTFSGDVGVCWNSNPDLSGSDAIQIRLVED